MVALLMNSCGDEASGSEKGSENGPVGSEKEGGVLTATT